MAAVEGSAVPWSVFAAVYLLWPTVVQILISVPVMTLFKFIYNLTRDSAAGQFCISYLIGTLEAPKVVYPQFLVLLCFCQICFSLTHLAFWVKRSSPPHEESPEIAIMELIFCCFYALHYLVKCIHAEFRLRQCWKPHSIIDILTIIPLVVRYDANLEPVELPWLSLSFLRAWNAYHAFEHIERLGVAERISEFVHAILQTILRTVALIVIMAGTVFTLEVLGEIEGFDPNPVTTDMGDLSFVQMCYWIMTTISTVGYGDFSPTTAISRITVSFFIIFGVLFFSIETGNLMSLHSLLNQGKGKYRGSSGGHVVVTGQAVGTYSSLIGSFLEELLHPEHLNVEEWPDVVILSETPISEELERFVRTRLVRKASDKVMFLVGTVLNEDDLVRVKLKQSKFALVFPDTNATNIDHEDRASIMRVIAMEKYCPKVRSRIMLNRPESKNEAMNVGIRSERCISVNELKAAIFTQSCRVHGFIPFVANLLRSSAEHAPDPSEINAENSFYAEYYRGLIHEFYGLKLNDEYNGMAFGDFAATVYEKFNFIVIGVQLQGKIMLAPMDHTMNSGDLLFVIATSADIVDQISAKDGDNWESAFLKNRSKFYEEQGSVYQSRSMLLRARTKVDTNMEQFVGADPEYVSQTSFANVSTQQNSTPSIPSVSPSTPNKQPNCEIVRFKSMTESELLSQSEEQKALRQQIINADMEIDDDTREEELKEAEKLRQNPGCITIVIASALPVWQQVMTCLRSLRADHLPFHQPVIVLSSQPAPRYLAGLFENVAILVGKPHFVDDLLRAGVLSSCVIIVLSGEYSSEEKRIAGLMDSSTFILCCTVENLLQMKPHSEQPYVIYEFVRDDTVLLLPHTSVQHTAGTAMYQAALGDDQTEQDEDPVCLLKMHPRYLAGQYCSPDVFGTLLGRMYYLPATIELVEALALPTNLTQQSFIWQTSVPPEFMAKSYSEMLKEYSTRKDSAAAIPVALFRMTQEKTDLSGFPYVLTNPMPSTVLKQTDSVIWLGPSEFGRYMHKEGLLQASRNFPTESNAAVNGNSSDPPNGSEKQPAIQLPVVQGEAQDKALLEPQHRAMLEPMFKTEFNTEASATDLQALNKRMDNLQENISRQIDALPAKLANHFLASNSAHVTPITQMQSDFHSRCCNS